MLNISNPLVQFVITASIGILAILAAILIPILIYRRQKNRKEITYEVVSSTLVLPILDIGEQVKSKLQILYDGKLVNDLQIVVLKVSNTGNIPIEATDFENNRPITFDFGEEAEIFDVEVLDTIPISFKSRAEIAFKFDQGKVHLEPLLLNDQDIIIFKVLLIKFIRDICVNGRISGVKEILGMDKNRQRSFPRRVATGATRRVAIGAIIIIVCIIWTLSALGIISLVWAIIFSMSSSILGILSAFSSPAENKTWDSLNK